MEYIPYSFLEELKIIYDKEEAICDHIILRWNDIAFLESDKEFELTHTNGSLLLKTKKIIIPLLCLDYFEICIKGNANIKYGKISTDIKDKLKKSIIEFTNNLCIKKGTMLFKQKLS